MPNLNPFAEHWYYNTESGKLTRSTAILAEGDLLVGAGWHELNISGNATQAQASAEAVKEFPSGKAPTTSIAKAAANTIPGVGAAESAIGTTADFLQGLTSRNLWIRIAKVIGGGIVLFIGVSHLTGFDNAVTRTATKVGSHFI